MGYTPAADDWVMAECILEAHGEPGFYQEGEAAAIPIRIQWVADADDIGAVSSDGPGPWESVSTAYVGMTDVPNPKRFDVVWIEGGARHEIDSWIPKGALWLLTLIPE
jgi:hypothetical protein